jgi:hypothetical protein
MASLKQIEANRRNAQKSTGPRSVAGKAVSSQNALKSGIDAETECIYGEDIEHLEVLKTEYLSRFQPATPEERLYVDTLIRCDWRQRRFARIDAEILEHEMDTAFHPSKTAAVGQAFSLVHTQMARLQRRIEQTERSYKNALHELERLQQSREISEPEPPPQLQPIANQPTSPQIGFVPQPAPETPNHPAEVPMLRGASSQFPLPPLRANPKDGAPSPTRAACSKNSGSPRLGGEPAGAAKPSPTWM